MNKTLFLTILFASAVCFTGFSQTVNIDSLRQIWHGEIDFIAKSIQENSIDYLRGITQEEWDEGIKKIHKKADEAKTNTEYYYTLRYFGALIKDGHAEFPDDGVYNRTKIFKKTDTIFPIWVKSWHDYRTFVVQDFSGKIPEYSEIISVNGISAKEISFEKRKLMPVETRIAMASTSSKNEGDPRTGTNFANYLFCENIKHPFVVEYKTDNDTVIQTVTLEGMQRNEIYKIQKKNGNIAKEGFAAIFNFGKNTIDYRKLNDSIGVLKINMFLGSGFLRFLFAGTDTGFYKKLAKYMKQIKKDEIKHLIIDLRDNIGGYEYDIYELLACFTDKKFYLPEVLKITEIVKSDSVRLTKFLKRTYRHIYEKNNPDALRSVEIFNSLPVGSYFRTDTILSMQYPPKYSGEKFSGKTYLLTNGMCYSASIIFTDLFKSNKLGLVVGESPGGYTIVTSGDGITIKLPFSKFIPFYVPFLLIGTTISEKYEYLTPDISIKPTMEEWLYDKHDSLDKLVRMIIENKTDYYNLLE
ncbi:MAG: S41 family peptidase [Prevotellaceae bacterium]|nr:S41 family peptidase [Prevotellaceae bacterium]